MLLCPRAFAVQCLQSFYFPGRSFSKIIPAKEANWIPTPKGKFMVIMRMYWPKEEVVDGKWTVPPVEPLTH